MPMPEEKKDEWEWKGTIFHKCPQCGQGIPKAWKSHSKCGWGKEEQGQTEVKKYTEEELGQIATTIVSESISEAKDILANQFPKDSYGIENILQVTDQIRRLKMFLQSKN